MQRRGSGGVAYLAAARLLAPSFHSAASALAFCLSAFAFFSAAAAALIALALVTCGGCGHEWGKRTCTCRRPSTLQHRRGGTGPCDESRGCAQCKLKGSSCNARRAELTREFSPLNFLGIVVASLLLAIST